MPFVEGESDGLLNSTTPVTVVAAPVVANTRRIVRGLTIFNADTASVTLTVRVNNNGTIRRIAGAVSLAANATFKLQDYTALVVLDSSLKKIEAVLAGAVTTNQPEFVASFGDAS